MPVSDAFGRKLQKIEQRRWRDLRDMWVNYPGAAFTPGEAPQAELGELASLQSTLDATAGTHPTNASNDINGLRQSALKEAFFNLQKAAYVLRAARGEGAPHFRTPSIATAYHSAFLAAKSVAGLLGICVSTRQRKPQTHLIDLHSSRIVGSSSTGPQRVIRIIDAGESVDHKELWALLQKVLSKTTVPPALIDVRSAILGLAETDFGQHRHQIQYRAAFWPFDEIRSSPINDSFAKFVSIENVIASIVGQSFDLSVAVAIGLIALGVRLLRDLADLAPVFASELEYVSGWLALDEARGAVI